MNWNKEEITKWLHTHDVYGQKTMRQHGEFMNAFIDEANKHNDTAADRKLYRVGLKIIDAGSFEKRKKLMTELED